MSVAGAAGVKFTVAITVWRRPHFLPHAVQSVIAQSHRDWEMRVYSDGSSLIVRLTPAPER